jgi:uncharacterized membrane protein
MISPTIPQVMMPLGRYGARNTRPQCSMAQVNLLDSNIFVYYPLVPIFGHFLIGNFAKETREFIRFFIPTENLTNSLVSLAKFQTQS